MRAAVHVLLLLGSVPALMGAVSVGAVDDEGKTPGGRVYYVRQTVGDDGNDGLSPASAWKSVSKLGRALEAGDTGIVGPGLYRDNVLVQNTGTFDKRITLLADSSGEHTGDPPGVVMISGAEPVDEGIFVADTAPGVFQARVPEYPVKGVVEMDGPQYRYSKAADTREYIVDGLSEAEVVTTVPGSYRFDEESGILTIHTTDDRHPEKHEIELIRRSEGISVNGKDSVTVIGFTFRHNSDAGIRFMMGAKDPVAVGNTSWGNHMGIRVYAATDAVIEGNTLFRNENSGVYFAKGSTRGVAVGNVLYENLKGIRWGSASDDGLAADNTAFDNREAGISIEESKNVRVVGNRVVNNAEAQIEVTHATLDSAGNCFDRRHPSQLITRLDYRIPYDSLEQYRRERSGEAGSREADCGKMPRKIDVRRLHAGSLAYGDRVRKRNLSHPE